MKPERKKISKKNLYEFGIKSDKLYIVNFLNELKESPPNIAIAKCLKTVNFSQNNFSIQQLIKNNSYVMSIGVFSQLQFEPTTKKRILKAADVKFKNLYRPYSGENLDNKILLVFRQGGIGDLLFIQPNLLYLKKQYPTCKIIFACGPQYQSMVREWECIDELIDLPFNFQYLMKSDYHCIFEGVIERCKEAKTKCSYNLFTEWMGLNLPDEDLRPKQFPNKEKVEKCLDIINKEFGLKEKEFITVQLSSSSPIRTPSFEFWIKLINMLSKQYKIIITDSPHKSEKIEAFVAKLDNSENVFNFSKFSSEISMSIALLSLTNLIIGTDSSLNHIAESLNVKSFAIMGPFPGNVRFSTYKYNDWIDCKSICSPCFIHSHMPCNNSNSMGNPKCYENMDYDECLKKIQNLMEKEIV